MESKNVELHRTGAGGATVSGSTRPPARLTALDYTFTMTGGARR
ncbi:Mycobacterium numidiamassiliense ORFan [Mycobacterium numidiamassiliense]|uniref:Mycobacterium numidiamassiliense ORFan n=1 Tax=Mycobacterium numidiamassiliense TaxID=1841861 RepID=A0A2U3PG96_9MYCO|nr:Mycobacterium numidiamassiliense ORFan [Mycobacterium numidiamassiliense]